MYLILEQASLPFPENFTSASELHKHQQEFLPFLVGRWSKVGNHDISTLQYDVARYWIYFTQAWTLSPKLWCSTWTDSTGAILSQVNYTLTNTSAITAICTLGLVQPGKISQIWNVTNTGNTKGVYTVFALPSWITQAGGIAANSNTTFGGIFDITSGSPQWTIFT